MATLASRWRSASEKPLEFRSRGYVLCTSMAPNSLAKVARHTLRPAADGVIIDWSITGGLAMCEEWWFRRRAEEAEASRRMWDEFERTRPLSDPDVTEDGEPEVMLEKPEPTRLAAKD